MTPSGCLPNTLCEIIAKVIGYLNSILFLLMALAIIIFIWYVIQYFIKPNEDRKDANSYIMYSVIGFFVILSIWGIVRIVQNTFNIRNIGSTPTFGEIQNLFPR